MFFNPRLNVGEVSQTQFRHSLNHNMLMKWSETHNWSWWSYLHLLMMKIDRSGAFPFTKQSLGQHNYPFTFNIEWKVSLSHSSCCDLNQHCPLTKNFVFMIVWLERNVSSNPIMKCFTSLVYFGHPCCAKFPYLSKKSFNFLDNFLAEQNPWSFSGLN